jgi:AcrR family transcriptional regulator
MQPMSSSARRPRDQPARTYDSTRRARQAAQTREEVLAAAVTLFNEQGWAATKLADIAARAGVAVETIYSGFGSKKGLLRAAMDVAVVGDAAPVPFSEREEFLQLGRGPLDARLRAAATVTAEIHERSSGVWHAIVVAAAGDTEVETWRVQLERGRRTQVEASLALIVDHPIDARTADICSALYSPEVYTQLTRDAGWKRAEYEQRLCEATARLLGVEPEEPVAPV